MLIPIVSKNDEIIGTASIERTGGKARDFSVTFYMNPDFTLTDEIKKKLERDLTTMALEQEKAITSGLSIYK